MSKKKKKKIKVRQFWPRNPATQVHQDQKNDYNRSKEKMEWEKEVDDALSNDDYDEFEEFDL